MGYAVSEKMGSRDLQRCAKVGSFTKLVTFCVEGGWGGALGLKKVGYASPSKLISFQSCSEGVDFVNAVLRIVSWAESLSFY